MAEESSRGRSSGKKRASSVVRKDLQEYDDFDYVKVLNDELERMKLEGTEENESVAVAKFAQERMLRIKEELENLTEKDRLEEMPQMKFRRLMKDDEMLGALSKHILEVVYP